MKTNINWFSFENSNPGLNLKFIKEVLSNLTKYDTT